MSKTLFSPSYPCILLLGFVPFPKEKMNSQLKQKMACHRLQLGTLYCNMCLKKVVLFGRELSVMYFLSSRAMEVGRERNLPLSVCKIFLLSILWPLLILQSAPLGLNCRSRYFSQISHLSSPDYSKAESGDFSASTT